MLEVGTPVYRGGAFILDKFLANQKEIQQRYLSSELVLATVEDDFADEPEMLLSSWGIRGKVLRYETIKPDYARSRLGNAACGREAIRQYTLSQTEANYLLWFDADMTYDASVIDILPNEIQGYDVVYSGYAPKDSAGYEEGFFLSLCHYRNENEARCVTPQPLGLLRSITTSRFVRYALIRASLLIKHDISGRLQHLVYRFFGAIKET